MPNINNDIAVLIPAYNEAATIRDLVERSLRIVPNVVVVDDGSSDATASRLHDLPVTLLRNQRNQGKAACLWRGFEHLLARASHFRPVRDIARIVLMVGGRLLKRGMYPAGLWRMLSSLRRKRHGP